MIISHGLLLLRAIVIEPKVRTKWSLMSSTVVKVTSDGPTRQSFFAAIAFGRTRDNSIATNHEMVAKPPCILVTAY